MQFRLATTDLGNATFGIAVFGDATLANAPALKTSLADVLEAGARAVLVDFSGATYIDSSALGTLMGAMKRLRPLGGSLVIVCADPNLRRIFQMTLLDRIFSIFETLDAGLAHMQTLEAQAAPLS